MTYADTIDLFGREDMSASETLIRLSMVMPEFNADDLLETFTAIGLNYRSKLDLNPAVHRNLTPTGPGSLCMRLSAVQDAVDSRTYYLSDIAFRNIWRIMFETTEWDAEILFQPSFFEKFFKFVALARCKARDRNSLDFWETVAEFEDRLVEKIKTASGV